MKKNIEPTEEPIEEQQTTWDKMVEFFSLYLEALLAIGAVFCVLVAGMLAQIGIYWFAATFAIIAIILGSIAS